MKSWVRVNIHLLNHDFMSDKHFQAISIRNANEMAEEKK
jgi:hypothetical protein